MKKVITLLLSICMLSLITACAPKVQESSPEDFEYSQIEGGIEITGYKGTDAKVIIPDSIEGKNVISIKQSAFTSMSNQENLVEVILPKYLESLGFYIFAGCSKLESITIPESVKSINGTAFGRTALKNITLKGDLNSYLATGATMLDNTKDDDIYFYANLEAAVPEQVSRIQTAGTITDENKALIYCTVFNQDTIKVNGKEYKKPATPTPSGSYIWDSNKIIFSENNEYQISAGGEAVYQGTYEYNDGSKNYIMNPSEDVSFKFALFENGLYLTGTEKGTLQSKMWIKEN